jgi:hypothetical protein
VLLQRRVLKMQANDDCAAEVLLLMCRLPAPSDRTAEVDEALEAAKLMSEAELDIARQAIRKGWLGKTRHRRIRGMTHLHVYGVSHVEDADAGLMTCTDYGDHQAKAAPFQDLRLLIPAGLTARLATNCRAATFLGADKDPRGACGRVWLPARRSHMAPQVSWIC